MATRQRMCALVLAVLTLGACTVESGPDAASGPATAPSSSSPGPPPAARSPSSSSAPGRGGSGLASAPAPPRSSSSAPGASSRLLTLTAAARITLTGQTYGRGLVMWDRYAAWVGCSGCERTFTEPTTLYVADLATRRVRAVATVPKDSFVTPLGGTANRLAYLVGTTGDRTLQWSIELLDLGTGQRSTAAKASQRSGVAPPLATVGAGQLVWQTFGPGPQGASHGPVAALDIRTGARRTVARDLPGVLSAVTSTGLVYRAPTGPATTVDQGLVDAFFLPASGGRARLMSETHDVLAVVADDATVAWQTNDGPDAAVWAGPLDGQAPTHEFYRGGTGDRAVGTGFLAVVSTGDDPVILLYPLDGGPVVAVGDVPEEFDCIAAEGRRLAYLALPGDRGVQPDAKNPITLVVTTVGVPSS
jgi:hypothetical protein